MTAGVITPTPELRFPDFSLKAVFGRHSFPVFEGVRVFDPARVTMYHAAGMQLGRLLGLS